MSASGLERFRDEIDPAVAGAVAGWRDDPELGKLTASLQAISERGVFLDAWVEAVLATHLLRAGCTLRVEVPTPAGRSCDFEVTSAGQVFYLHVKRFNPGRPRRSLSLSPRLRYLERVRRPYVVSVRVNDDVGPRVMQRFVTEAAAFIRQARVGDETVVRDEKGTVLGGCRVLAPWEGSHVSVVLGLPKGFEDEAPRVRRLLRKAHKQFMPRAANVILIASAYEEDVEDVANALLGTHIERWDAHPPPGQRVAHGRGDDGFWAAGRAVDSQAAGWFSYRPRGGEVPRRLWVREGATLHEPTKALLVDLFDSR